jgi:hypothetical protein
MEIPGLVMEIGGFDTETAPLTIFSTQKWRFLYTKQLQVGPKQLRFAPKQLQVEPKQLRFVPK